METNRFKINDKDVYLEYGIISQPGLYAELLKMPAKVYGLTKNWPDQNGTARYMNKVSYSSRDVELKLRFNGISKADLLAKYKAFKTFIQANVQFDFNCLEMNRLFKLKYVSMPAFEKLTVFEDNNNIWVNFSLQTLDDYPTTFLNSSAVTIPMSFPAPKPDGDIDFSSFDYQIVDGNLLMIGDGSIGESNKLNGNDIFQYYGLITDKGMHNELLKLAEAKGQVALKFNSRDLELPFILHATSELEFYYKYYALVGFFLDSNYFNFDDYTLNKRYSLCYSAMTSFDKLTVIRGNDNILARLKINCIDDFPTQEIGLLDFDGAFSFSADGDLIYTQNNAFDGKIIFGLSGDNLTVTT